MSSDEPNAYEVLSVAQEASEAEIRKAYRQRSLKVHPDRNPDNPDAARLFHELTLASAILLDPARRALLDARLRVQEAKRARTAQFDSKRKTMLADLEEREEAFKKARMDKARTERTRWQEDERVKEEGRRMREERERRAREAEAAFASPKVDEAAKESTPAGDAAPALGPLDTTVRLKYTLAAQPDLTTTAAVCARLTPFGTLDARSSVLQLKPPAKPKRGVALVPFEQVVAAFAAVGASGRKERGLEGVEVAWAGGAEPELIGWLRKTGRLGNSGKKSSAEGIGHSSKSGAPETTTTAAAAAAAAAASSDHIPAFSFTSSGDGGAFSSFPSSFPDVTDSSSKPSTPAPAGGLDLESLTLLRMRQAERERLEREIQEQEAADG